MGSCLGILETSGKLSIQTFISDPPVCNELGIREKSMQVTGKSFHEIEEVNKQNNSEKDTD